MPKYNSMISKAVDLVARQLVGMESKMIAHFTRILSEEAQIISEDLQHRGQHVKMDILVARLDGFLKRMKYELFIKGPDLSPYEFPIFNVSHHPTEAYPYPINHLYDERYREAYSSFIEQSQPTSSTIQQQNEPITSTFPTNLSSYPAYFQPETIQWNFINPYSVYYQQPFELIHDQSIAPRLRPSSTYDDLRPYALSRSNSDIVVNYSINSKSKQIPVHVIYDKSSSINTLPRSNKDRVSTNTITDAKKQQSSSMTKRVIIIDRDTSLDNNQTISGRKRLRTSTSAGYNIQQPKTYIPIPNNVYSTTSNGYYPFVRYPY